MSRLFASELAIEDSTDEYYTPHVIFDALGVRFDIDVAAPPGGLPWIPTSRHYSKDDDGLTAPWDGHIWCNPPYSAPSPWCERMAAHRDGIMLLPADTSTKWWQRWVTTADAWCFISGRVRFVKADAAETPSWTGRFPSVLVGWGDWATDALTASGLGWTVTR